ncbi:NYN domain-containing protein [Cognatishimia maritima]|uniref:OST-HTH/LOTUS domain-containing protein n=1 Tax=Cognatishimia maritima TaxID=870908 RepID=A0A1M5SNB2_9RHOB|nr:NYN domain-containing protein [Cognatishimia maritima]SHH39964.1 OST-HTH/LOTUS domain-containing protein [Cognatishimia maritima]
MKHENNNLAILIDADNVTPKVADGLFAEIAKYGTASVKRIYGDWTKPALKGWKDCLLEHSIQPIQQFAYTVGKNSTDSALIIDAMDLLYSARFSGFCIVSSDSDFVRLATRIREQGLTVFGFGERKTPRPFIAACDRFVYFDILNGQRVADGSEDSLPTEAKDISENSAKSAPPIDGRLRKMLKNAIEATSEDDGTSQLSRIGSHLAKQSPDFDSRNYGYKQLSALVEASGIANVKRVGNNPTHIIVSLK